MYPQTTGRASFSPVTGMQMRDTKGLQKTMRKAPEDASTERSAYLSRSFNTYCTGYRALWGMKPGRCQGPRDVQGQAVMHADQLSHSAKQQAARGKEGSACCRYSTAVRAAAVLFSQAPFLPLSAAAYVRSKLTGSLQRERERERGRPEW